MQTYIIHRTDRTDRPILNHGTIRHAIVPTCKPLSFRASLGAWGCYLSHVSVLTHVWMLNKTAIVLEDDCLPIPEGESPEGTLFDLYFLGGQHKTPPIPYNDRTDVATHIHRSHAYYVTPKGARIILDNLEFRTHFDHEMTRGFSTVYCAHDLVGTYPSRSDVS